MAEKVQEDKWIPDFGGQRIHPTGGVVAVGARPPLIAFNINLATDNEEIAKKIANIIREVKGGFKCQGHGSSYRSEKHRSGINQHDRLQSDAAPQST